MLHALQVSAVIGARMGAAEREYLVLWVDETEDGEPWETWEPYRMLMVPDENGDMEIAAETEMQVALLDQLTIAEELAALAIDQLVLEREICVLSSGARVLWDRQGVGFVGGVVRELRESGEHVGVLIDGESSQRVLRRSELLLAPLPTAMKEGQCVRVAFEHDDLPAGAMRWQYGKLSKVHAAGELVDIAFDNGEVAEAIPTYDVELASMLTD